MRDDTAAQTIALIADGGRGAEPFIITIAVIIATTAAPVHACARCALPRLSGNGGTM